MVAIVVAALLLFGGDEEEVSPTADQQQAGETAAGVACGGQVPPGADAPKPTYDAAPEMQLAEGTDYTARIRTSCGEIVVDLLEKETPITVNSFVFLAREGLYDGLTFHRVIEGFMNQGGDPAGDGTGGPGYQFEDEIVEGLAFDETGLLAMANAGPGTNGSQFFITVAPAEHLNGLHTIFGRVTEGMDVVERINGLQTDAGDRPVDTVYIESVTIEEG